MGRTSGGTDWNRFGKNREFIETRDEFSITYYEKRLVSSNCSCRRCVHFGAHKMPNFSPPPPPILPTVAPERKNVPPRPRARLPRKQSRKIIRIGTPGLRVRGCRLRVASPAVRLRIAIALSRVVDDAGGPGRPRTPAAAMRRAGETPQTQAHGAKKPVDAEVNAEREVRQEEQVVRAAAVRCHQRLRATGAR